jgi:hypothetical protein
MLLRLRRELRDERTGASRNHCQMDAHNLALNTQGFDLNQLLAEPLEVVDRGISTLTPGGERLRYQRSTKRTALYW